MEVNENANLLDKRIAFDSIASKLAPTGGASRALRLVSR